jgi:hypothetical protein
MEEVPCMKIRSMKWVTAIILFCSLSDFHGQCTIKSDVQSSGLIYKHTEKELLYTTKKYKLFSAVFHDGEKYYLKISIRPLKSKNLKSNEFTLQLKDGKKHKLGLYDSFQTKKDTTLDVLFNINEEILTDLTKSDVSAITISIETGPKRYKLVDHHALIRKQFNCMQKEMEKN